MDHYIDNEFHKKAQPEYTCISCGWSGSYKDLVIAVDARETGKLGIKVEVMFCGKCGGDEFK